MDEPEASAKDEETVDAYPDPHPDPRAPTKPVGRKPTWGTTAGHYRPAEPGATRLQPDRAVDSGLVGGAVVA